MPCRIIPGRYVFSDMNAIQVLNVRGGGKRVYMDKISEDNRRKEKRTQVDENVYVVVDTQPEMMGQMVEISSTGMAFTFVDLDAVSNRLSGRRDLHVDLFAAGKGYFIRNLPARLVSTIDSALNGSFASLMIKRIGVEFGSLSLSQQVQINSLIRRQNDMMSSALGS